jgi:chaperonin GroES
MGIKVLGNKILVKELSSKTEGRDGIIIPDSVRPDEHSRAEVISKGAGDYLNNGGFSEPRVSIGDKIFYNHYAAIKVTYDGVEYKIIEEKDILFIEEEK